MKKQLTTILFLLMGSVFAFAQSYDNALGMRLGTDWGITYKHRLAKKTTAEVILQSSLFKDETVFSILGEQHLPFLTRRVNMFAGGGLHRGWYGDTGKTAGVKNSFGVTGIVGLEMTVGRWNLTYDFKPLINLSGGDRVFEMQTGISIRYVLIKRKWLPWQKKRKKKKKKKEGSIWPFSS